MEDCIIYDHSAAPGSQWQAFASLPEERAGGALLYNSVDNELIFTAGANRPEPGSAFAVDHMTTWTIDLGNPAATWVQQNDLPYGANHIRYAQ